MDKETLQKYAPMAVVVLAIIFQYNLFVTPEKLEQKHREILTEVSQTYATKTEFDIVRDQLSDMQKKLDKIYDIMTRNK